MSKELKVGDRVKLDDDPDKCGGFCASVAGLTGIIIEKDNSSFPYLVRFDGCGRDSDWGRDGLSLIEDDPVETQTLKSKLDAIEKLVSEVREMIG